MKTILLVLLVIALGFLLLILGYIMLKYLGIIYDRIDEYFDMRERAREQEEIYKFKKNL